MVAPDLQGRGLGRELLAVSEGAAPASVTTYWLTTGVVAATNHRFYRRAGYRRAPGEPTWPGAVDLVKPRQR
jgi:tRNA (guanine37-N1)-methyltransferase